MKLIFKLFAMTLFLLLGFSASSAQTYSLVLKNRSHVDSIHYGVHIRAATQSSTMEGVNLGVARGQLFIRQYNGTIDSLALFDLKHIQAQSLKEGLHPVYGTLLLIGMVPATVVAVVYATGLILLYPKWRILTIPLTAIVIGSNVQVVNAMMKYNNGKYNLKKWSIQNPFS